jgi:hypothetical protein
VERGAIHNITGLFGSLVSVGGFWFFVVGGGGGGADNVVAVFGCFWSVWRLFWREAERQSNTWKHWTFKSFASVSGGGTPTPGHVPFPKRV